MERPLQGHPCRGFFYGGIMGYRKISYAEQVWYILKYKLRELFHKRKGVTHAKKTKDTM